MCGRLLLLCVFDDRASAGLFFDAEPQKVGPGSRFLVAGWPLSHCGRRLWVEKLLPGLHGGTPGVTSPAAAGHRSHSGSFFDLVPVDFVSLNVQGGVIVLFENELFLCTLLLHTAI